MKRILAIILIISGFSFLIFKFLNWKFDIAISLMINIIGFIPIVLGYTIFKSEKSKSNNQINSNVNEKNKPDEEKLNKISSNSDHSRYMPK